MQLFIVMVKFLKFIFASLCRKLFSIIIAQNKYLTTCARIFKFWLFIVYYYYNNLFILMDLNTVRHSLSGPDNYIFSFFNIWFFSSKKYLIQHMFAHVLIIIVFFFCIIELILNLMLRICYLFYEQIFYLCFLKMERNSFIPLYLFIRFLDV